MTTESNPLGYSSGGIFFAERTDIIRGGVWAAAADGMWLYPVPSSAADPLDLYKYFPTFTRVQDLYAGLNQDWVIQPILQKLVYMLEKESGGQRELVEELVSSINPDVCSVRYVDYLAFLLGERIPSSWSDDKRRGFLQVLAALIRLKGLHLGFKKRACFAGQKDAHLVELFKHEFYEQYEYSDVRDPYFSYQSARVDMVTACLSSCESWCESLCESMAEAGWNDWLYHNAKVFLDEIGEVLPVNVLLRKVAVPLDPADAFLYGSDTIGCASYCESWCEASCESIEELWPGSEVRGVLDDSFWRTHDAFSLIQTCVGSCEASCQICCECGAEGTCHTGCEVVCETMCEDSCQTPCMSVCQTSCQYGSCEEFGQT